MTAEAIASVVADLRAGRIRNPKPSDPGMFRMAKHLALWGDTKVVDSTAIYNSLIETQRGVAIYEDHPCIAPQFERMDFCYVNGHGNVVVMSATGIDYAAGTAQDVDDRQQTERWFSAHKRQGDELWEAPQPEIDWSRVRWEVDTIVFVGGRGGNGPAPTTGPVHLWRFAIYDDGSPADLRWVQLVPDYDQANWDMAHLVLLGSLPDMARRWCTSDQKTSQVRKLITQLARETVAGGAEHTPRILNVLGMRAAESPKRAGMLPFEFDKAASSGARHVDRWLPIHGWTTENVWECIRASGVRHHPAYDLGMPRLSCVLCVFASKEALQIGIKHNPELAQEYARIEVKLGHTFRKGMSIAELVAETDQLVEVGPAPDWAA